jgi:hypothetical protein
MCHTTRACIAAQQRYVFIYTTGSVLFTQQKQEETAITDIVYTTTSSSNSLDGTAEIHPPMWVNIYIIARWRHCVGSEILISTLKVKITDENMLTITNGVHVMRTTIGIFCFVFM